MGVHQDEETLHQVKKLLDIPEDEPIFILRAQDLYAPSAISEYKKTVYLHEPIGREGLLEWMDRVRARFDEFINWQRDHREKVKVPD